jgi:hypothetical protein
MSANIQVPFLYSLISMYATHTINDFFNMKLQFINEMDTHYDLYIFGESIFLCMRCVARV